MPDDTMLTAETVLEESVWYLVRVAMPGPPFLGYTSLVFGSLLKEVRRLDPTRSVCILYTLRCSHSMPVTDVRRMASLMVELAGDHTDFLKLAVSTSIGRLQRFRQPSTSVSSMVTQDVRQLLRMTSQAEDGLLRLGVDTLVHNVALEGSADPAVVYEIRDAEERKVVSTQSYLPVQLAVHNMSYLLLWQLQRSIEARRGYSIVGFATDSVTFVAPAVSPLAGLAAEGQDGRVRGWLA
jgi:hypothetical protein